MGMLRMAYEAKSAKPKPSDRTEMINAGYEALIEAEQSPKWKKAGKKAPTRPTVVNWLSGETATDDYLYLEVLSKVYSIPMDKLF